jgi:hypothetical protein
LEVSASLHARVQAFFVVFEGVMGENVHRDTLPDLVVTRGLDALLTDLLMGQPEEDRLLTSLLAMSRMNPQFVYEFFANMMQLGSGLKEWWQQLLGPPNA